MSKTSLPRTVARSAAAVDEQKTEERSAITDRVSRLCTGRTLQLSVCAETRRRSGFLHKQGLDLRHRGFHDVDDTHDRLPVAIENLVPALGERRVDRGDEVP